MTLASTNLKGVAVVVLNASRCVLATRWTAQSIAPGSQKDRVAVLTRSRLLFPNAMTATNTRCTSFVWHIPTSR